MGKNIIVAGAGLYDSYPMSFYTTLKRMGYSVYLEDPEKVFKIGKNMPFNTYLKFMRTMVYRNAYMRPFERRLLRNIDKYEVGIVMIIAPHIYNVSCITEIKKANPTVKIVSIFGDALSNFDRQYMLKAPYDYYFFKDKYIVEKLKHMLGLNTVYLPQCFDPTIHRCGPLTENDKKEYSCDITTAGNMYYYKEIVLERLIDYDMKLWGHFARWIQSPLKNKWTGRYVAGEEKAKAFKAAKICFNVNHYAEIAGVNKRTFEICGCGGFQLTNDSDGLRDVFEPDIEVGVFKTVNELREKVDYYLNNPEIRSKIALAGYQRALRDHTFEARIRTIFNCIGID